MPTTPKSPEEKDARERANAVLTATGVLEIYSDGLPDPWKRVREKYPEFADKGRAGAGMSYSKFNAETVLVWAAGVVAGDAAKQAMAARVFRELTAIAMDEKMKPSFKLSALRLLGWECGMFAGKAKAGDKPAIRKMQHVFLAPKRIDDEDSDPSSSVP
jgi:hypothetical protein